MPAAETPHHSHELTLAEELALLALDDKTGKQLDLPANALGYGLAGAKFRLRLPPRWMWWAAP